MHSSLARNIALAGLAVCLAAGTATPASAERGSKLDVALRGARREDATAHRVIVQARAGERAALKRALQSHGDLVLAEHPSLNALTVLVHGNDLDALDAHASVLSVSSDALVSAGGPATGAAGRKAWEDATPNLLRATLGLSGSSYTGAGVNVAVLDSGIDATRDLRSSVEGFWDFTAGGVQTRPYDDFGHGTHVAGLIASSGVESGSAFAGVAPRASLFGFKVLDNEGRGRVSDVVSALEFIVANKLSADPGAFRIDVINLSLGHPIYEPAATDPLVRAVERAARAGIVVITAAGNAGLDGEGKPGYAGITSPGNAPSALTVGAADTNGTVAVSDDTVAGFSSRGPTWFDGFAKPDVVAAGVGLMSDLPRSSPLVDGFRSASHGRSIDFGTLSGTSMAAAVATGVAALVLEANESANAGGGPLPPNALKAVLQYTAFPLVADGQAYDPHAQGTGELNAVGAITLSRAINTSMPAGAQWLREVPQPETAIGGEVVAWSRALLWDDNIVWGTDAVSINSLLWDDNIVWGTWSLDDNIVWGTAADFDNIVWGTADVWANQLVRADGVIGMLAGDNIVWGTANGLAEDNIVWGTVRGDNIVWGTLRGDNIVWGTAELDNIVWGTFRQTGW